MAPIVQPGFEFLGGERDREGHRTWKVRKRVIDMAGVPFGQATALAMPGLPQPGDMYLFTNPDGPTDIDAWAFCTMEGKVQPEGRPPCSSYAIDYTYTTNAPSGRASCKQFQVDDPLLQPPKISIDFIRKGEEATLDRFGRPIQTSSWEQIRGAGVEFDEDRIAIMIEMNTPFYNLGFMGSMSSVVNAFSIWGAPARTIRLTPEKADKNYYGACHIYFTQRLRLEYNPRGWDRDLRDEGTKCLFGQWNKTTGHYDRLPYTEDPLNPNSVGVTTPGQPLNPDPKNPAHFIKFLDKAGNAARVILDGGGLPYDPTGIETTDECGECDFDGDSPLTWYSTSYKLSDSTATLTLGHTGGCAWNDPNAPGGASLAFSEPDGLWVLQIGINLRYTMTGPNWSCHGPNTLLLESGGGSPTSAPPSITLREGQSTPGVIHVEKYNGVDFLLLGLPAVIV